MRYEPEDPPFSNDVAELKLYILAENRRIALAIASALPQELVTLHAAPTKLREFLIVAADGTDWNPGAGKGVYAYYSGSWNKLG